MDFYAAAPGWFSLLIVAIWVISILQSSKRKAQKKREMEAALSRERKTIKEVLRPQKIDTTMTTLEKAEREAQKQTYRAAPQGQDLEQRVEDLFKSIILEQPAQTAESELAHDESLDWYHDQIAELEKQNDKLERRLSHLDRLLDQKTHEAIDDNIGQTDQAESDWINPNNLGRDMVTRIILGPPRALARRQISVD